MLNSENLKDLMTVRYRPNGACVKIIDPETYHEFQMAANHYIRTTYPCTREEPLYYALLSVMLDE